MSKHTPRPWYLDEMTGCICGPDGKPIMVCGENAYRYGEGTAEALANNQLFYAAPDLLASGRDADAIMTWGFIPPENVSNEFEKGWEAACEEFHKSAVRQRLCAAIAKAEGEEG